MDIDHIPALYRNVHYIVTSQFAYPRQVYMDTGVITVVQITLASVV